LKKAKDEVRRLKTEMTKTADAVTKAQEKVNRAELNLANAAPRQRGGYTKELNKSLRNLEIQLKAQELYRQNLKAQYAEKSSLLDDKIIKSSYNKQKGTLTATVRKNIDDQIRERTYLYNENTASLQLQKESYTENTSLINQREKEKQLAEQKRLKEERLAKEQREKELLEAEKRRLKAEQLAEERKNRIAESNKRAFASMKMEQPQTTKSLWGGVVEGFANKTNQPNLLPSLAGVSKQKTVTGELKKEVSGLWKEIKAYKPGKLLKSFGRIATYRAIRTVLSTITNSLKQGVDLLKNSNPILKETMTQINTATTGISVSLGSMLMPILQTLEPILTNMSNGFIAIANGMNYANEATHKNGQYFRINAERVREYAESLNDVNGALTQLDKFATLSKGKPILGEWVEKNSQEAIKDLQDVNKYSALKNVLTLINGLIVDIMDSFTNLDNHTIEVMAGVAGAVTMLISPIKGVIATIASVALVLSSDLPAATKIGVVALAGVTAAAYALFLTLEGTKKGLAGILAAVGVGATILASVSALKSSLTSTGSSPSSSSTISNIGFYATGGFPSSGEIFVANEAGAEMIGTIGGRTAVANNNDIVNSVSTGVYGAVSRAFSENSMNGNSGGDVYLDNTKVGRVVAKGVYTEGVKAGFWGKK
jgi:hypothetical protein